MKKVKQANGYIIYQSTTQRDVDNYHCEIGNYNIYLATDIRDYGLSNSYAEWEDEDSLAVAIARCNGSQYAVACALADELSDSTVQDMDLVSEIERRLEAGEALESIRESYDTDEQCFDDEPEWKVATYRTFYDGSCVNYYVECEGKVLYDGWSVDEVIERLGFNPNNYPENVPFAIDARRIAGATTESELDEDELDGDLEDVFAAAMAEADSKEYYGLYAAEQCPVDDPREFSVYCPNCGQKLPCGPEDIYYDDLGWHTVCPVCDGSFDVDPPQEWLDYDWIPADHVLVPEDSPFRRAENPEDVAAMKRHSSPIYVPVYADTTGFFTDAECDKDNTYEVSLPANLVYEYLCEDAGYDIDTDDFWWWVENESTCDDTLALMEYARNKGIYPIKAGLSTADYIVRNEHRSHATYAVLRDPDTDEYRTMALPHREDEPTKNYNARFLTNVAMHYAFNDCGGSVVEEIVIDGIPVVYDGWRPMMEMVFRIADTGEIIYDVFHDEWDH